MEFNSPRPEHAQLQGPGTVVHPKGTSAILSTLNNRILASSTNRNSTDTTAGTNSNNNGSNIDIINTSVDHANTNRTGNNGNQNKNNNHFPENTASRDVILGDGFTLVAPRPVNGRDASLYEPIDEYLIPSPPLSPMEGDAQTYTQHVPRCSSTNDGSIVGRSTDVEQAVTEDQPRTIAIKDNKNNNGIVVKGVWDNYASNGGSKRYQLHINAFLSQYKVLKPMFSRSNRSGSSGSASTRYTRRTRTSNKTYASNSDFEKVYRTRRATSGTASAKQGESSDESPAVPYVSRSVTPVPRKKVVQHHPSPLSHSSISHHHPTNHHHHTVSMSWEKLPDYSPPLDTLPNNNKCLKVDWKGSSMDLSNDPLKHKLHPAELVLAQILRLPCDLYLDSKRRFFMEKVHRLKQGMPFRRTDAQKACRIDVNKASRLFAAYEKIGWLQDSHFKKFL